MFEVLVVFVFTNLLESGIGNAGPVDRNRVGAGTAAAAAAGKEVAPRDGNTVSFVLHIITVFRLQLLTHTL